MKEVKVKIIRLESSQGVSSHYYKDNREIYLSDIIPNDTILGEEIEIVVKYKTKKGE